jgi:signal transduction histidine kinase
VLVERIRAGGVEVETRIDGLGSVPPQVDAAAYRILQESLTNVLRHSDGPTARVRIHRSADAVVVEVTDDGPAKAEASLPPSAGAGIRGMRARAEEVNGTFEAGPRPEGGFAVTARLPVSPQSATSS